MVTASAPVPIGGFWDFIKSTPAEDTATEPGTAFERAFADPLGQALKLAAVASPLRNRHLALALEFHTLAYHVRPLMKAVMESSYSDYRKHRYVATYLELHFREMAEFIADMPEHFREYAAPCNLHYRFQSDGTLEDDWALVDTKITEMIRQATDAGVANETRLRAVGAILARDTAKNLNTYETILWAIVDPEVRTDMTACDVEATLAALDDRHILDEIGEIVRRVEATAEDLDHAAYHRVFNYTAGAAKTPEEHATVYRTYAAAADVHLSTSIDKPNAAAIMQSIYDNTRDGADEKTLGAFDRHSSVIINRALGGIEDMQSAPPPMYQMARASGTKFYAFAIPGAMLSFLNTECGRGAKLVLRVDDATVALDTPAGTRDAIKNALIYAKSLAYLVIERYDSDASQALSDTTVAASTKNGYAFVLDRFGVSDRTKQLGGGASSVVVMPTLYLSTSLAAPTNTTPMAQLYRRLFGKAGSGDNVSVSIGVRFSVSTNSVFTVYAGGMVLIEGADLERQIQSTRASTSDRKPFVGWVIAEQPAAPLFKVMNATETGEFFKAFQPLHGRRRDLPANAFKAALGAPALAIDIDDAAGDTGLGSLKPSDLVAMLGMPQIAPSGRR